MPRVVKTLLWTAVSLVGAIAVGVIALTRGETINATWFVVAAVAVYAIGYRFYSALPRRQGARARRHARHAGRAHQRRPRLRADEPLDRLRPSLRGDRRARPADRSDAGGAVRLSARHAVDPDRASCSAARCRISSILFCSMRRDGKSLGQMAKEEIGPVGGFVALIGVLAIMIILHRGARPGRRQRAAGQPVGRRSPWARRSRSRCSWAATCERCARARCCEASVIGVVLLLLGGRRRASWVDGHPALGAVLRRCTGIALAWA